MSWLKDSVRLPKAPLIREFVRESALARFMCKHKSRTHVAMRPTFMCVLA